MIHAPEIALLARLLETGECRGSEQAAPLIRRYETAGWISAGTRRGQWRIRDEARSALSRRLGELLPTWPADFDLLRSRGRDPFSAHDIGALPVFRRARTIHGIVNRRNWNAIAALGPKHRRLIDTDATLTRDWMLRLRPNRGLKAIVDQDEVDLGSMGQTLTECALPERFWLKLQRFSGTLPDLIITCENLGAYVDLPAPESAMAVFPPGKDIDPAAELLRKLPDVRWIHFGDLDPDGIAIAKQLAQATGRKVALYVPSFAEDYLDLAHPCNDWELIELIPKHVVLETLRDRKRRLFQEVFMLDDRLAEDLASCAGVAPSNVFRGR